MCIKTQAGIHSFLPLPAFSFSEGACNKKGTWKKLTNVIIQTDTWTILRLKFHWQRFRTSWLTPFCFCEYMASSFSCTVCSSVVLLLRLPWSTMLLGNQNNKILVCKYNNVHSGTYWSQKSWFVDVGLLSAFIVAYLSSWVTVFGQLSLKWCVQSLKTVEHTWNAWLRKSYLFCWFDVYLRRNCICRKNRCAAFTTFHAVVRTAWNVFYPFGHLFVIWK